MVKKNCELKKEMVLVKVKLFELIQEFSQIEKAFGDGIANENMNTRTDKKYYMEKKEAPKESFVCILKMNEE